MFGKEKTSSKSKFFFSSEEHGLPSLRSQLCTGKRVEWKKRIFGAFVCHGVYCLYICLFRNTVASAEVFHRYSSEYPSIWYGS